MLLKAAMLASMSGKPIVYLTPALVQGFTDRGVGSGSLDFTLAPTGAGNFLLIAAQLFDTSSPRTFTPPADFVSLGSEEAGSSLRLELFGRFTTGGETSFSIESSGGLSDAFTGFILEISNIDSVDSVGAVSFLASSPGGQFSMSVPAPGYAAAFLGEGGSFSGYVDWTSGVPLLGTASRDGGSGVTQDAKTTLYGEARASSGTIFGNTFSADVGVGIALNAAVAG